jgi:hypothetical protein
VIDNPQPLAHNGDTMKNQAAVELGRLGGKAGHGKCKARTPEQARAAALVRWEKARRANETRQNQD